MLIKMIKKRGRMTYVAKYEQEPENEKEREEVKT